jgi:DNA-binding NtrC family response regulator
MDLKVAGMQGLEILRRIMTLIPPGIPIIIVTANASAETALNALKYGASDYLSKPLHVYELRFLIEKAIK